MSDLLWITLSVGAAILALTLVAFAWLNRRQLETDRQLHDRLQRITVASGAEDTPMLREAEPRAGRTRWQILRPIRRWQAMRRQRQVEAQFPDTLDMLVNALRAGYAMPTAMEFIGQEMPAPIGPAFHRFHEEQRLGIDLRTALLGLQERLGTSDAHMFVLALLIQRETGGNLAEILGNISTVIRERVEFRNQVQVLTAESRLSATILTALPILLFLLIRAVNPSYVASLTDTRAGVILMLYAMVSLTLGTVMLRRMAAIEV